MRRVNRGSRQWRRARSARPSSRGDAWFPEIRVAYQAQQKFSDKKPILGERRIRTAHHGLSPRFDGIGQHDGDSSGHHGMMNAAEDFRVHPCGIRAEDLVLALLVYFSNRLVSGRFGLVRVVRRSRRFGRRSVQNWKLQPKVLIAVDHAVPWRSSSRII
jgi:hypothetical protein